MLTSQITHPAMDRTYSDISLDLDINQLLEGDIAESSSQSSSSLVSVCYLHRHDGIHDTMMRIDPSGERTYVPKEVLKNGAKLAAVSQTGDFTLVRTTGGVEGFLKSSHLTRAVNQGDSAVLRRYDDHPTTLRQQPSKEDCWVQGKPLVHNNEPVFVVHSDTNGEFTFVRAKSGAQGYVKSQYLVPAGASVISCPIILPEKDDFKLMLRVYKPVRAWAERRYGAHPTRRLIKANGQEASTEAVVQAASELALAMCDREALAEVDAKMGTMALSCSFAEVMLTPPTADLSPPPAALQPTAAATAPTLAATLASTAAPTHRAGERTCHKKKCHVCCGTIGVHKNSKLGVILDDRCRKQLSTFQQGRTITERREEWIAALQAMPGQEWADKMLHAVLEPEAMRDAKKRKYKLEKAAEEQTRLRDQTSLLGKRDRTHDAPFAIDLHQHELQVGSGMDVSATKAADLEQPFLLDSQVSEQMTHLVGKKAAATTTTTNFVHTSVPHTATMLVEQSEFQVEDIADLTAAMEADEEDRKWEGRQMVMLNGKYAGRYGVVQRRTAKKHRIQLNGVPYALEFYAGSFALVQ